MKKVIAAFVTIFSALIVSAMEPDVWFASVDKDKDGRASPAEWITKNKAEAARTGREFNEVKALEKFKERDLDKDGFISLKEFLATKGPTLG